jgi:hypothetical protein
VERLRYILGQGVEATLVERVLDWPGAHCAAALLEGTPLEGHWFDRPREYAARNQGEDFDSLDFATTEKVELTPIPCWAHLSPDAYRRCVQALVDDLESQASRARKAAGTQVLGVAAILAQDPQHRPTTLARSPAPLVHAATKAARKLFHEIYAAFVSAFRVATEALRRGERDAPFPPGSFPPALPLVAGCAPLYCSLTASPPAEGHRTSSELLGKPEVCPDLEKVADLGGFFSSPPRAGKESHRSTLRIFPGLPGTYVLASPPFAPGCRPTRRGVLAWALRPFFEAKTGFRG